MSDHSTTPLRTHCQNCDTELKGPYCHQCGQHDFDFHKSWGHVIHETLEGFFHFDGKLFRGLFDLLFRPGWLTARFNQGKRASQVPPLRFYIFISLLFFLAPSSTTLSEPLVDAQAPALRSNQKTVQPLPVNRMDIDIGDKELEARIRDRLTHPGEIEERFHHYLPRVLLGCLPVFALLSLWVFRKAGLTYLQHLVWALHLHTFFYLFFLVGAGWRMLLDLTWGPAGMVCAWLVNLWLLLYPILAIRRVFGSSVKGAIARGLVLMGLYGMVIVLAFTGAAAMALLLA